MRDREADLKALRECEAGAMAVWDELVGPKWSGLRVKDFEVAGFVRLYAQSFTLKGYILDRLWFGKLKRIGSSTDVCKRFQSTASV